MTDLPANRLLKYSAPTLGLLLLWLMAACSVKKYIPEDEHLYKGAELKVVYPDEEKKDKELNSALSRAIYPKPNGRFLGMYLGLWAHYKKEAGKDGIISRFINKRYGEEPVYLSDVNAAETESLLRNRAVNRGYFFPEISSSLETGKHKGSAHYVVKPGVPYRLMSYQLITDSTSATDSILRAAMNQKTALDTGAKFSLDRLKQERRRIDEYLKNRGYYFFNSDYLLFRSDTNQYELRGYDLFLSIKDEIGRNNLKPYEIRKVNVFVNLESGEKEQKDTASYRNLQYVQYPEWVKPKYLDKQIIVTPDSLYRLKYARNTVRRLSSIRAFQHANIRFSQVDSGTSSGLLDASLYLAPARKHNVRAGMHGFTKSTGFAGPGLVLTFEDRNLFKGAELLEIRGVAGYEFQISRGRSSGLNNFEFRLENSLSFPRLLAPFIKINPYRAYSVPNTKISLNFNYQQRALYYSVNNFYAGFGYNWFSQPRLRWELTPLSVNFTTVYNRTPEFEEILANNPFLARSFDDQFITANSISLRYNEFNQPDKYHRFYIGTSLEQAGFLLGAVSTRDSLFGEPYAQFVKTDVDFRYDWKLGEEKHLVNRIFVGVGFPYGNSQSLPYIKQYFAGGPNSLRAFPVRSVGPGSFVPQQIDDNSFFDQAGDIRIEFNTEYRFPMVSYLKGAVFVDVGNVWLYNDNPSLPGSQFSSDWYRELAMGAGFGFRVDVQVLVVRLDIAHPLVFPSEEFNAFFDNTYSFNNLVWNFAIGYPF